jgi:hypothetical protein
MSQKLSEGFFRAERESMELKCKDPLKMSEKNKCSKKYLPNKIVPFDIFSVLGNVQTKEQ